MTSTLHSDDSATHQTSPAVLKSRADAARLCVEKMKAEYKLRRPEFAARSAKISRDIYAEERRLEGRTVRAYRHHDHEPQRDDEDHEDRQRRMHRDRQRTTRGVTAETVRVTADLSSLSADQKIAHSRQLANQRKAAERSRKRSIALLAKVTSDRVYSDEELKTVLSDLIERTHGPLRV
jgi:hypothetical protein